MTFIRTGGPYPYDLGRLAFLVQRPTSTDMGSQEASVTSPVYASFTTLHNNAAQVNLRLRAPLEQYQTGQVVLEAHSSASPDPLQEIDPGDPFSVWLFYLYICFVHL